MSRFKQLGAVAHLSASRWGDAEEIDRWHRNRKPPFSEIGYHKVILNGCRDSNLVYFPHLDGKIEPGRDESKQGAHCLAEGMNAATLGVCCIGTPGFPPEGATALKTGFGRLLTSTYMTEAQLESLLHVLLAWCKRYDWDPLGKFRHPFSGNWYPVISTHSDWDKGKPLCASLRSRALANLVAKRMQPKTITSTG